MEVLQVMLGITLTITSCSVLFAMIMTTEEVKPHQVIITLLILLVSIFLIHNGVKRNRNK
ncbi:hypothetical protein D0T53_01380 [Dysgonomonas sp. 216]|nr:hypothetical protein [Dysgonomonas sp. 216]